MKATIPITKEVEIKILRVKAGVRYWEDASINGNEDTEGKMGAGLFWSTRKRLGET